MLQHAEADQMRSKLLGLVAAIGSIALVLAASDVSGTWVADVETPFGSVTYTFTFHANGAALTGTAASQWSRFELREGRVEGDRISFVEETTFDNRPVRLQYTGQLVGDELRFSRTTGQGRLDTFVARREGAPPPVVGPFPFQDSNLDELTRLKDLVSRMTLDEKIAALGTSPSVPRLGVRRTQHVEGLHGLAYGGPSNWGSRNPMPTTIFPQAVGLGQTWDSDVVREVGRIEGYEARFIAQSPRWRRGGLIIRAPNADLSRDIRWGRTEESFGEDAFLAGALSVAFIKGLQGDDPRRWQAASLMKHLLANSNENGREHTSSDFDERLLHEYYSAPFRMGVMEGRANAYMAAYNKVNGVPSTVQPFLRRMTMEQWGLDGIICTDGGALGLLVTAHKYYPALDEAAAASIKAGITVFLDRYPEAVRQALQKGLLAEADVDAALMRNFRVSLKLGLLDSLEHDPYGGIGKTGDDPWTTDAHKDAVRRVTQKSIVLLKNDTSLLPLDRTRIKSIAVIGPRANDVLLDWYSGTPPYTVTPLVGIRNKAGAAMEVSHARDNTNGEAVKLARAAAVAIVVVGNHPTCDAGWAQCPVASDGKEAVDRRGIDLEQEALVRDVHGANPRTILVLKASFPFAINWSQAHVPAILTLAHNSQEEGNALADVLFGEYNPAGRVVHTWPRSVEDLPPILDYDLRKGRTYMYSNATPLYPFGFGLSYTTFTYSNLRLDPVAVGADGTVAVKVDVRNGGQRAGEEVVQVYVSYASSRVPRPARELKGFARVAIGAGETTTVSVPVPASRLGYWDVAKQSFVVEPGQVKVFVGSSSADLKLNAELTVR
jgi:beta-glucosidase